MKIKAVPSNLEEAIETIIGFYVDDSSYILSVSTEEEFMTIAHFGRGMFIRNSWNLWWHKNKDGSVHEAWPKEKPEIITFFHNLGIVHPDDMSGIIFTSVYRRIKGLDIDLLGQVEKYQTHWKKEGFLDGIPKMNNE